MAKPKSHKRGCDQKIILRLMRAFDRALRFTYWRAISLATYEKNLEKADDLLQTVISGDEKPRQGYRQRLEIREVLADRLAREIVLEPKR